MFFENVPDNNWKYRKYRKKTIKKKETRKVKFVF